MDNPESVKDLIKKYGNSDERHKIHEQRISKLIEIYGLLDDFLKNPKLDRKLITRLIDAYPNYMNELTTRKQAWQRKDFPIIVTGETSAGKSTLLNRVIGKDVFVSRHNTATTKIVRVRNSNFIGVRAFSKKDIEFKRHSRDCSTLEQLVEAVKSLTDMEEVTGETESLHFVDVHLPVPELKGNTILVDTPGVGESEELRDMLKEYIPQAICFIFVVNVANADGMQEDRMLWILRTIVEKRNQMPLFDAEDVIFITNKWDAIVLGAGGKGPKAIEETERTWTNVKDKVKRFWPAHKHDNIFRMNLNNVGGNNQEITFPEIDSTKTFEEFQNTLQNIIQRNEKKRTSKDIKFLDDFVEIAGTGIRLWRMTMQLTQSQKDDLIRSCQKQIKETLQELKKEEHIINQIIQTDVESLAKTWNDFLHRSETKDKILNPENKKPILEIGKYDLKDEIGNRCVEAIQSLWKRADFTKAFESLQQRINKNNRHFQAKVTEIESKLKGVEILDEKAQINPSIAVAGRELYEENASTAAVAAAVVFSPVWIPVAIVGGTFYILGRGAQTVFRFGSKMIGYKEKKIDAYYCEFMARYDYQGLKMDLDFHFGNYFRQILKEIDKSIRQRRLNSLTKTVESIKKNDRILNELKDFESIEQEFMIIKNMLEELDSIK